MFKWLFLSLLGWLIYRLWHQYRALKGSSATAESQPPAAPSSTELMVKCAYCDLHLPQKQAINHNNQWFCSTQHKYAYTNP